MGRFVGCCCILPRTHFARGCDGVIFVMDCTRCSAWRTRSCNRAITDTLHYYKLRLCRSEACMVFSTQIQATDSASVFQLTCKGGKVKMVKRGRVILRCVRFVLHLGRTSLKAPDSRRGAGTLAACGALSLRCRGDVRKGEGWT